MRMLVLLLALPLFTVLPMTGALAATFTVGPVGTPGACTHTTLLAAIDAAALNPGPDEIRATIATSELSNVNLVVQNQTLSLRGGFPDCAAATPTGRTQLSGAGGLAAPVLKLLATGVSGEIIIVLEGFDLTRGDNTANGAGGGLEIQGRGQISIKHCSIANNSATRGAGIGVSGAGLLLTSVSIGDGVQIEDNTTTTNGTGGGLYAYGATVTLGGIDTVVRRNVATTNGGGIYLTGDSNNVVTQLLLKSGGQGADGVLAGNRATQFGGGLYLLQGAEARLYTTDPQRPVRLNDNRASQGGAIFMSYGGGNSRVDIWDAQLDANQATNGGGTFYVFAPGKLTLGTARDPGAPSDARPCTTGQVCNRIHASSAPNGAVLLAGLEASLGLLVRLQSIKISSSVGRTLFDDDCDANTCTLPATMQLQNVQIATNPGVSSVVQMGAGVGFECDLCTIAAIGPGPQPTAALFETNGPLSLTRSVIYEPGRDVIGVTVPQPLKAAHLLVHDASDFPVGGGGSSTVRVGDPLFQDPDVDNYRLSPTSPALDAAPVTPDAGFVWVTPTLDRDGQRRVFDDPAITNLAGPVDLGAFELDTYAIFNDGFE